MSGSALYVMTVDQHGPDYDRLSFTGPFNDAASAFGEQQEREQPLYSWHVLRLGPVSIAFRPATYRAPYSGTIAPFEPPQDVGYFCMCFEADFDDAEFTTPVSTVEFIGPFATSEQLGVYTNTADPDSGPYGPYQPVDELPAIRFG